MKKILSLLALGCIYFSPLRAQDLMLGVKAGAMYNTPPFHVAHSSAGLNPIVGLQLVADFNKFQVGGGLNLGTQRFNAGVGRYVDGITETYFQPNFFGNYKLLLPHSYFYTGANFGVFTILAKDGNNNRGVTAGVQVGYSLEVAKHLHFAAQFNADYFSIDYYRLPGLRMNEKTGMVHFPLTAGLNYTF